MPLFTVHVHRCATSELFDWRRHVSVECRKSFSMTSFWLVRFFMCWWNWAKSKKRHVSSLRSTDARELSIALCAMDTTSTINRTDLWNCLNNYKKKRRSASMNPSLWHLLLLALRLLFFLPVTVLFILFPLISSPRIIDWNLLWSTCGQVAFVRLGKSTCLFLHQGKASAIDQAEKIFQSIKCPDALAFNSMRKHLIVRRIAGESLF